MSFCFSLRHAPFVCFMDSVCGQSHPGVASRFAQSVLIFPHHRVNPFPLGLMSTFIPLLLVARIYQLRYHRLNMYDRPRGPGRWIVVFETLTMMHRTAGK